MPKLVCIETMNYLFIAHRDQHKQTLTHSKYRTKKYQPHKRIKIGFIYTSSVPNIKIYNRNETMLCCFKFRRTKWSLFLERYACNYLVCNSRHKRMWPFAFYSYFISNIQALFSVHIKLPLSLHLNVVFILIYLHATHS